MPDLEMPHEIPLDLDRFMGTWFIVATNYAFWRSRTHPVLTYERIDTGDPVRFHDTLRFRSRGLFGGEKPSALVGIDTRVAGSSSRFLWRGMGLLAFIRSPWWVVAIDPDYLWAVTFFGRSNIGTAPGMDIYARTPQLEPAVVTTILEQLRQDPFMRTRCDGLFATVQPGAPVYTFG